MVKKGYYHTAIDSFFVYSLLQFHLAHKMYLLGQQKTSSLKPKQTDLTIQVLTREDVSKVWQQTNECKCHSGLYQVPAGEVKFSKF